MAKSKRMQEFKAKWRANSARNSNKPEYETPMQTIQFGKVIVTGHFKDNTVSGKGNIIYPEGNTYTGDIVNGYPNGKGKKTSHNGIISEGEFVNGRLHGKGKITYPDGNTYIGDTRDGTPYGKGKKTFSYGTYEGDYVRGLRHGNGKLTFNDGNTYEGKFVKDAMHGEGKVTYADGFVYQGKFQNNRPEFSYSTDEMKEMLVAKYSEDIKEEDMNAEVNLDGSLKPEGFTTTKLTESQIQAHAKDLTTITKSVWKNRSNQNLSNEDLMQVFK